MHVLKSEHESLGGDLFLLPHRCKVKCTFGREATLGGICTAQSLPISVLVWDSGINAGHRFIIYT